MAQNHQIKVSLMFDANTSQAKASLKDLQTSLNGFTNKITVGEFPMTDKIKEAYVAAEKLKQALNASVNMQTGQFDISKFNFELKKAGLSAQSLGKAFSGAGNAGAQAFSQLATTIANAEIPTRRVSVLVGNLAKSLKQTVQWQLSSSVVHGFTGALQQAYGYAQDLNRSLTDIRIVTGENLEFMERFAKEANKAAKELSTTTNEYAKASLIFYQQGLSDEDVAKRTAATMKMANVTGESAADISSYMTAIWNNFDNGTKSLEYYADAITALGAATASSTEEIAGGMQQFASVAETVGLSYEYAASALATVVSATRQSEETVGTSFKTIFARLSSLQLGEELEDGTTLTKYSAALAKVGIDIKDGNNQLKSMDKILDELGAKWHSISKEQQTALAYTVAGTRQYNNFISLLDNYEDFKINVELAIDSEGSLNEQQRIYAESWEAAADRVKAAAESIYEKLLDDDFFITMLNHLEKFITGLDKFIDSIGGLPGVLSLISTLMLRIFSAQVAEGLRNMTYTLKSFVGLTAKEAGKTKQDFMAEVAKGLQATKNDVGNDRAATFEIAALEKKVSLEQTYLQYQDKLNEKQRSEYNTQVQLLEILRQQAKEKQKQADKAKEKLDESAIDLFGSYSQVGNQGSKRAQAAVAQKGAALEELQNARNSYDDWQAQIALKKAEIEKAEQEFQSKAHKYVNDETFGHSIGGKGVRQKDGKFELTGSRVEGRTTAQTALMNEQLDTILIPAQNLIKTLQGELADLQKGETAKKQAIALAKQHSAEASDALIAATPTRQGAKMALQKYQTYSTGENELIKTEFAELWGTTKGLDQSSEGYDQELAKFQEKLKQFALDYEMELGEETNKVIQQLIKEVEAGEIKDFETVQTTFDEADQSDLGNYGKFDKRDKNGKLVASATDQIRTEMQTEYGAEFGDQDWDKYAARVQETTKAIKDGTKANKKYNDEIDETGKKLKKQGDKILPDAYESFVQLSAGISGAVMMFSSLGSVWDTLKDPELSGWEKLTSIFMSIGSIVPVLLSSFSSFKAVYESLNKIQAINNVTTGISLGLKAAEMVANGANLASLKALVKEKKEEALQDEYGLTLKSAKILIALVEAATEAKATGQKFKDIFATKLQNAGLKSTIATKAAMAATNVVLAVSEWLACTPAAALAIIIAALAAGFLILIGVILLAVAAFKAIAAASPEAKLQVATDAANALKEALKGAKEEAQNLADTINTYDDAVKSIDTLIKGTEEYQKAVAEANEAARTLIDNYDLAGQYHFNAETGLIEFDEDALENLNKQADQKVAQLTRLSLGADNAVIKAEENVKVSNMAAAKGRESEYFGWDDMGLYYGLMALSPVIGATVLQFQALGTVIRTAREEFAKSNGLVEGVTNTVDNLVRRGLGSVASIAMQAGQGIVQAADALGLMSAYNNSSAVAKGLLWSPDMRALDIGAEALNAISTGSFSEEDDLYRKVDKLFGDKGIDKLNSITDSLSDAYYWTLGYDEDDLAELREALKANTQAILENNTQIAASLFAETSEYENSSNKQIMAAMGAVELSDRAAEIYESTYRDQAFGITDAEIQREYAQMMGYTDFKNENGNKAIYYTQDGQEIHLTDEQVRRQLAQKKAEEELKNQSGEIAQEAKQMANDIRSRFGGLDVSNEIINSIGNDIVKEKDIDLGSLTPEQIKALEQSVVGKDDDISKALLKGIEEANRVWENQQANLSQTTKGYLQNLVDSELGLTRDTLASYGAAMEELRITHGAAAAESLNGFIQDLTDKNKEQANAIVSTVNSIDWSDPQSGAIQLENTLYDMGIYLDDTSGSWANFLKDLETANSSVLLRDLDKVRETLATINELAGDLDFGDVISDEDFAKLRTYSAEVNKLFIMTAEGYRYIGEEGQLATTLNRDHAKDLADSLANNKKARSATEKANAISGGINWANEAESINSMDAMAFAAVRNDFALREELNEVFAASGINLDTLLELPDTEENRAKWVEALQKIGEMQSGVAEGKYEDQASYEVTASEIKSFSALEKMREIFEQSEEGVAAYNKRLTELTQAHEMLQESIDGLKLEWLDSQLEQLEETAFSTDQELELTGEKLAIYDAQYNQLGEDLDKLAEKWEVPARRGLDESIGDFMRRILEDAPQAFKEIEQISESYLTLMDNYRQAEQQLQDSLVKYFEDTSQKYDKVLTEYEKTSSSISHYQNVLDLVNASEKNYEAMSQLAEAETKLATASLGESRKKYEELRRSRLEAEESLKVAIQNGDKVSQASWAKTLEELNEMEYDALENMNDSWTEALEAAAAALETNTQRIMNAFETSMTGLYGSFDRMQEAFDQQSELNSQYVADYKKVYELSKMTRSITEQIDNAESVSAKQSLRELQEEVNVLQANGVEMSEYDLEYLQKKYDLRVAEIALEEAQNAKNQVRLQRTADGSWGYVYTENAEVVDEAQQNYEDALFELQDLSASYLEETSSAILSTQAAFNEAMSEIMSSGLSDEEKKKQIDETVAFYEERLNFLTSEFDNVIANNQGMANMVQNFSDSLLGAMYPSDEYSNATSIFEKWRDELGSIDSGEGVLGELGQELENYDNAVKDIFSVAGFESMDEYVQKMDEELNGKDGEGGLMGSLENAVNTMKEFSPDNMQLTALDELLVQMADYKTKLNKELNEMATSYSNFINGVVGAETDNDPKVLNPGGRAAIGLGAVRAARFDSGGYTGSWGSTGKMAILDEKELVLDKEDTANILSTVDIVRAIGNRIDLQASAAQYQFALSQLRSVQSSGDNKLSQEVTIHAEFPNATNHSEIEQAFDTLINRAAQYTNRKRY